MMANSSFLKLHQLGINLSDRDTGDRSGHHKLGSSGEQAQSPERFGDDDAGGQFDRRGNRDLSTVSDDEVWSIHNTFRPQLDISRTDGWIRKGRFCLLGLRGGFNDWPLVMFGRVMNCSPAEGYAQDMRQVTIQFPQKKHPPHSVDLRSGWINPDPYDGKPQSYCMKVRIMATAEELAGFAGSEALFHASGFEPVVKADQSDVFMSEISWSERPWILVIGSQWFSRLSASDQKLMRANIDFMLGRNRIVLNYHADGLGASVPTLNRLMGFKHGISKYALYEPANAEETVTMLSTGLDKMLKLPLKDFADEP